MIDLSIVSNYVIDGTIGGVLYILVSKLGYKERWDICRRLIMGAISGLVVYYIGLPNHLSAMGIGYIGIDALEPILLKYGKKLSIKKNDKDD